MSLRLVCGTETEYGFQVEGRSPHDQIDDATAFVRTCTKAAFVGWDYRHESPRADLRGFSVDRLATDPADEEFESGRRTPADSDVRSDRVLPCGARFYNDHGHPEYATPECFSLSELVRQDRAGERFVASIARDFAIATGRATQVYKNNTDFHGASYGTHESYLVPRSASFEALLGACLPMLVARQVLCGSGKVGAESGARCDFQISQRADFLVDAASVETLFRRPVFNTRDEPHAESSKWMRLHVISGDANMLARGTRLKVGLIWLVLALQEAGCVPVWRLADAPAAFRSVSRDVDGPGRIELAGRSWTTAHELLESYFAAADTLPGLDPELAEVVREARELLAARFGDPDLFARRVDWAAKRRMISGFLDAEGETWTSPVAQSLDLAYHDLDSESGLFPALLAAGEVEDIADAGEVACYELPRERTRAYARSVALCKFGSAVTGVSWGSVSFIVDGRRIELRLDPEREYPERLERAKSVEEFVEWCERSDDGSTG